LQGLGILYAFNDEGIVEALKGGRLKRILADWSPTFLGLFLYYPSKRHTQPALRAFIDCLRDEKESKRRHSATG
jgi:DNA-binding transcriptional LysR family regulator